MLVIVALKSLNKIIVDSGIVPTIEDQNLNVNTAKSHKMR